MNTHSTLTDTSALRTLRTRIQGLVNDRRGAAFTEYLIIVGIVALLGITIFAGFRRQIGTAVTGQGNSVGSLGSTPSAQ